MITEVSINYLTVLIATVVSFLFGGIWYNLLFGKTLERVQKVKMGAGKSWTLLIIFSLITTFITAWVLACTVKLAGATTPADALLIGFVIWLGYFAVTHSLGMVVWQGKSFKVYLIDAGFWLVNLIIMSMILVIWA